MTARPGYTPLRPQFQTTECGVAVLRTVLAYYGRELSSRELRRVTAVSRDCLSASDLRRAALVCGLTCEARSLEPEQLAAQGFPLVVHLRFIHFVVLEAMDPQGVSLNCPATGRIHMEHADFHRDFTGIALKMRPGPEFQRTTPSVDERRWWMSVARIVWPLVGASLGMLVLRAALTIALAVAVARSGGVGEIAWLVVTLSLAGLAAGALLQAADTRLCCSLRRRILNQLCHLALSFYAYRIPLVLMRVVGSIDRLTRRLTHRALPAAFAIVELLLLLAGAIRLDLRRGVAFAGCTAIALCVQGIAMQHERWAERSNRADPLSDIAMAAHALEQPGRTRLGDGPERLALQQQGAVAHRSVFHLLTGAAASWSAFTPMLLVLACLLASLALEPAAGTQTYAASALLATALGFAFRPLTRLRGEWDAIRRIGFSLRDVLDEPHEAEADEEVTAPADVTLTAVGLHFGFNPRKPPLVRDLSFEIRPGEHVGVTGPSGGGKSTLTELLAGVHRPDAGEVCLGGVPILTMPMPVRSRLIARVDRRAVVFEASLRENITLWDESISEATLHEAVRDAELLALIESLPGGLDFQVEASGRNLSGGQLQRLELARALVRQPRILILDDAMDALDLPTELAIRRALRRRGCTMLLVTHRASSLAACDRTLHFAEGGFRAADHPVEETAPPAPSIFSEISTPPASPPLGEAHATALAAAMRLVAGREELLAGQEYAELPRPEAMTRMAARYGVTPRLVHLLMPGWWHLDFGPVLAFRNDGAPVALVERWGHHWIVDPGTGSRTSLDDAAVAALDIRAYMLLPQATPAPRTTREWLVQLWTGSAFDLVWTVFCTAATALCIVLLLLCASDSRYAASMDLLLGAGLLLLWRERLAFVTRSVAYMDATASHMLHTLLLRVSAETVRSWRRPLLYRALEGLSSLRRRLRDALERGSVALVTLVAAACGVRYAEGWGSASRLLAGATVCIAVSMATAFASRRRSASMTEGQLQSGRLLYAVLFGIERLRLTHRDKSAFERWMEGEEGWRRLRVWQDGIAGSAPSLNMSIAMATLALMPAQTQGSVALAGIALLAASDFGAFMARVLRDRPGRMVAGCLLAAARDAGSMPMNASSILSTEALTHHYPGVSRPVFSDLSVRIDPTKITVLAGPSGGGKSTLLRLLLGFQRPSSGRILIGGHPIEQVDLARWHTGVAAVFQGEVLEESITIRGHLDDGSRGLASIWQALELVEMDAEIRRMPMGLQTIVAQDTISNGQQQRLLIARALLSEPALLVLDEATSAIPDAMQARILIRLRERGLGCLMVSHRETVMEAADMLYLVDHGLSYAGHPSDRPTVVASASRFGEDEV